MRRAVDSIVLIDANPTLGGVGRPSNSTHFVGIDFDTVSGLMGQFTLTGDLGENPRGAPFA